MSAPADKPIRVHLESVSPGVSGGGNPPKSYKCEVASTMRTFVVAADPVCILGLVTVKRRALLYTKSNKVVITSEPGEAAANVSVGGGNGVNLPNADGVGPAAILTTTSDVWAVSTDGTPQTIGVIAEYEKS